MRAVIQRVSCARVDVAGMLWSKTWLQVDFAS